MISTKREKRILLISFLAGLAFALTELLFALLSHSQSALTDAMYDTTELVFVGLLVFLIPLFHSPISEKRPYGYFQVESIFLIVKGFMMLSVSLSVAMEVIGSALTGGNSVNYLHVCCFQLLLGIMSTIIYFIMKKQTGAQPSPTVVAELLGWRLDIANSLGMAGGFLCALFLEKTRFDFLAPYFDQIVAMIVMLFMLPENVKIIWTSISDLFLFSPEEAIVEEIKAVCGGILQSYCFEPVFYEITRTGRHLWVTIDFRISKETLNIADLKQAHESVQQELGTKFSEFTCELVLNP